MRSLNAKIPIDVAVRMVEKEELNPQFVNTLVTNHILDPLPEEPISGMTVTYSFKAELELHRTVKLKSIEYDIPMNELLGRLIATYYK